MGFKVGDMVVVRMGATLYGCSPTFRARIKPEIDVGTVQEYEIIDNKVTVYFDDSSLGWHTSKTGNNRSGQHIDEEDLMLKLDKVTGVLDVCDGVL